MKKLLVYMVRYADGYEEVRFVAEKDLAEAGGVAAFESDLSETAAWFYPIGKIKSHSDGHGGLHLPMERISALAKAWEEHGSPKVMERARGPPRLIH